MRLIPAYDVSESSNTVKSKLNSVGQGLVRGPASGVRFMSFSTCPLWRYNYSACNRNPISPHGKCIWVVYLSLALLYSVSSSRTTITSTRHHNSKPEPRFHLNIWSQSMYIIALECWEHEQSLAVAARSNAMLPYSNTLQLPCLILDTNNDYPKTPTHLYTSEVFRMLAATSTGRNTA